MSDSNQDAYEQIGKEGGTKALAMVADYMERSGAANDRLMNSLYEGERAAHERTKERLAEAEAQLSVIHHRIMGLLFDPPKDYERGIA
jgi:cellobiose-specific phosphotransferase system component IIA